MFFIDLRFFWLAVIILFCVIEAATVSLTVIWFAVGACAALLVAFLHGGIFLQLLAFIAASAVCLALLRPLAKSRFSGKPEATNADRVIGREAVVTEEINNLKGTGAVRVDGITWTARALTQEPISEGSTVLIRKIEGVKVIVEADAHTAETTE